MANLKHFQQVSEAPTSPRPREGKKQFDVADLYRGPAATGEVQPSEEIALDDPNVDSLFISIVPHTPMLHTTVEEIEKDPDNIARRIIRQHERHNKPMVVSVNAGTMYNALVDILEMGGIPTYTTAERAMHCLNSLADHYLGR